MNIQCTARALEEIERRIDTTQNKIKLVHNVEGCGCVNDGVAQLTAVEQAGEYDLTAKGKLPILYDYRTAVFYEDEMFIDFLPHKQAFILKSHQQTYNPAMRLIKHGG